MSLLFIPENMLLYISGFGIFQGFLLSGLLFFHPKSDRSVNKFLSLYIACLSVIMAGPVVLSLVPWQKTFFVEPFTYLVGPLMYLYVRSFKETINWSKALPHVSLFFLYFFVSYWRVSFLGNKYPGTNEIPEEALKSPISIILVLAKYSQLLLYYFMSRRELGSYQRSIHQLFTEANLVNFKWGKCLLNGYILIVLTTIVLFPLMVIYPKHFSLLYVLNIAIVTPYIYIIAFKGIMQPTIWQIKTIVREQETGQQIFEQSEGEEAIDEKQMLQKTGLSDIKISELVSKIIMTMEDEKLYQETELTLHSLAKKLDCPPYQVSQAINDGLKKNFYDLINSYRVEEAKRLLLHPKNRNYTVLSVGFEAGFNSKTTFNTVFKKFTGLTPTDFREKQKETLIAA